MDDPSIDSSFSCCGDEIASTVKLRSYVVERHGCLVAIAFSPNSVDIGRRLVSAG